MRCVDLLGTTDRVRHEMETTIVANHSARVETLQPELFVVQLSRGLRVRFDEHLNMYVMEAARGSV